MERSIAHFDLDSFFVSVERLKNPSLIGKPVVVGGNGERGVVASASYEARQFGIHSAMSSQLAKRLCPDALFIRGDHESYSKYSTMVTEVISESVPVLEKASIDEFYCDLTGMEKFFGCFKWASEIQKKVYHETGLITSLGLSTSKTVSKMATNEAKPNGKKHILYGAEKEFLFPLGVEKLPSIGKATTQTLRDMGIRNIGTLAAMPLRKLESTFGKNGRMYWERANGIDLTPIEPYHEQKSHSREMTFNQDTTDITKLKSIIYSMVEGLTFDLRKQVQCAGTVTVKIRYSNFDTHTKQANLHTYTTNDNVILKAAIELFDRLYDRRLLIRLIGVRLSSIVRGHSQISIFDNSAEMSSLHNAMDRIKLKFGEQKIGRAFGAELTTIPIQRRSRAQLT